MPNELRSETIIRAACIHHGVTRLELLSRSRVARIARARQSAMFVMRHEAGWGLQRIANLLRRSDHTTVLHGLERAADHMRVDADYRDAVGRVRLAAQNAKGGH